MAGSVLTKASSALLRQLNKSAPTINFFSTTVDQSNISKSQNDALLNEHCILVDKKDSIIGSASKLDCHIWDPVTERCPLHRAFSVFLFNTKGELLLQQRSDHKVTFPSYITNSCCSHPLHVEGEMNGSEGVLNAARRRLEFELGIPADKIRNEEFTYLTRILYNGRVEGSKFAEHEIDYVLFLKKDVNLAPNPEEIKLVEYVPQSEFRGYLDTMKAQGVPMTPWFNLICSNFLNNWWSNLDKLDNYVDHESIHQF